jgi:hypothetical protein
MAAKYINFQTFELLLHPGCPSMGRKTREAGTIAEAVKGIILFI